MRRIVLSLTVMAIAVLMSTSLALAASPIYCPSFGACYGTKYGDVMYGPDTGTKMYGYDGNDYIYGYGGDDVLFGLGGKDWLYGGLGSDKLYGGDGDDYLYGDGGQDEYIGWHGNDKMYDRATSSGTDTYFGLRGSGNDVIFDSGGPFDVLDLSHLSRSEVLVTWVDTSDSDTNLDSLRAEQKGATNNSVLVRNYFDNSGGLKKGSGATETIKFKDKTVYPINFPISEG